MTRILAQIDAAAEAGYRSRNSEIRRRVEASLGDDHGVILPQPALGTTDKKRRGQA